MYGDTGLRRRYVDSGEISRRPGDVVRRSGGGAERRRIQAEVTKRYKDEIQKANIDKIVRISNGLNDINTTIKNDGKEKMAVIDNSKKVFREQVNLKRAIDTSLHKPVKTAHKVKGSTNKSDDLIKLLSNR